MNWEQADEIAKKLLVKLITKISKEIRDKLNSYHEEDQIKIRSMIYFYLDALEKINSD